MSKAGSLASTDAICSQAQNVVKELGPTITLRGAANSKGCRRPRTFSVARLRLNPCARGASIPPPLAPAGKPTREERHGQGSDAQHQGKEEAEGGVEQEEKRRSHPLAVRVGPGASPTGPEPLRQEELAERPIDGEGSPRVPGRGAMLLDPPLAGRVANAEAAGAMPIHPPSGEGFARIDNLHLRKSDPAHLSGPGLREESELFRLDPCLDDGPALDMHAGCRKSAANVVKSFLFWVLCYFCLPSGLPWPNQIASKRFRLSFRKARS